MDRALARAEDAVSGSGRIIDEDASCGTADSSTCEALTLFGGALHTAQDFYLNTNWADRHDERETVSTTNPAGLARSSLAPALDP